MANSIHGDPLDRRAIEAMKLRTIIIGNSGSGKSTLAQTIGQIFSMPVIDLDSFHWEGEGYGRKRDKESAIQMASDAASAEHWIIEGVFGWLAEVVIERATALIWMDLDWDVCRTGLLARGLRRGSNDAEFMQLVAWSEAYWTRETSTSFKGHLRMFERFASTKLRLRSRAGVNRLVILASK